MNLSEPFIRRPVMTTLVMLAIIIAGLLSYAQLAVSNLPDVNYPTINVTVSYPGATPITMANFVAQPLEKQFMAIPGITSVTSSNTVGSSNIVLQFDISKNIDSAAQDVQAAITTAKGQLPPNLPQDPIFKKVNPADTPIMLIALTSDTIPIWDLYEYAFTFVGQRLSMLEGVAQVVTYGSPYAVRVQVKPGLMAAKGITLQDVSNALQNSNPNLPTGQLNGPSKYGIIQVDGQLPKADLYNPLVIKYINGSPVRISDIGQSVDGIQTDTISQYYVDKNYEQQTVILAVLRQPGANTIKVADSILAMIPQVAKGLPASLEVIKVFDQSESIRESIFEVKLTLFIAFILVVMVIYIYLGSFIDTIIPSLAMPMSIVATFIVMYFCNYTIDTLSMMAFTLAIGFIIDDAIVVLENIARHVEAGDTPWEASLKGSRQISFTILSMTLSLAAVFIPLLFMTGLIGKIFQEFSVTLVVVTLASGVISLTLTPMLCSRFIPPRGQAHTGSTKKNFSEKLNEKMLDMYKPALVFVLKHPPYSLAVAILCLVLTIVMFKVLPLDFIPNDDIGFITGYVQAQQGTSSYQMAEYQKDINETLIKNENVETILSIAGSPDVRQAIAYIKLKPFSERKGIAESIKSIYEEFNKLPGLNLFLKNVPLIDITVGPISRGSYQYSLQTLQTDVLYASAIKMIDKLQNDPNFVGVSSDLEITTPQLNVDILRDQSSSYGVNATDIENIFLLGYSQNFVSRIETALDQYDVILELDKAYQYYPSTLSQIYLTNSNYNSTGLNLNTVNTSSPVVNTSGAALNATSTPSSISSFIPTVPLDSLIQWTETLGPASINHISQFPSVTISFNIADNVPLGTAIDRLNEIAKESLEPGINGTVQGAAQTFQETIRGSFYLLLFSVFCIYIVLGILYESFIHPITILSTLPPAIVGGLLTLYLLGYPLSLYGYLGIILLIGIVKKNGILMVDYALDNIRTKGETPEKSIYEAAIVRFRPIMMTTFAAIMGAIPIAIGLGASSQSRKPLGYVIIGGLIVSQLITLLITPVIYLYMEKLRVKLTRYKKNIINTD